MDTGCIYNIDITTNDNQVISVSSDNFNHFYIANIDDDGNEMNYVLSNPNTLYANFFMLRIVKDHNYDVAKIIDRLYRFHDIIKIGISFTNGKYQEFDIAKKRVAKNGCLENVYEEAFLDDEDLCILITDKKIRYKENLFA